jgi:ketosteroid isomerase-like protein
MNSMSDQQLDSLAPLPMEKFKLPSASVDIMRVRMEESYDVKGIGKDTVQLHGWIAVIHDNPRPVAGATEARWGTATTPTSFVGLELKGNSELFGPVHVTFDPTQPSNGAVGALRLSMLEELAVNNAYTNYRHITGSTTTAVERPKATALVGDSAEIAKVMNGVLAAISHKNGREIIQYYAPGAENVYFSAPVPPSENDNQVAAFTDSVSKMFAQYRSIKPVADDDLNINVSGDVAQANLTGHNEVVDAAGRRGYNSWKWSVKMRKDNGQWRIAGDDMAFYNDPNAPKDADRVSDPCASGGVASTCSCSASVAVIINMPKLNLNMSVARPVIWYSEVQTVPPVGATASVSFSPTPLLDQSGRQIATLTHGAVKFRQVVRKVPLEGTQPTTESAQLQK